MVCNFVPESLSLNSVVLLQHFLSGSLVCSSRSMVSKPELISRQAPWLESIL